MSGGGIRSASFSLGVIQKLAHDGRLRNLHYLSTVSGGGYMGSSLTWYLSRTSSSGPCYGTDPNNFPFLGGEAASNRRKDRNSPDEMQQDTPPPDGRTIIDFIRQRSSCLVPGRGLGLLSAFGIVLRSIIVSLFAYFLLFTLLALVMIQLDVPGRTDQGAYFLWAALALLAVVPVTAVAYSLIAPSPIIGRDGYRTRRWYQAAIGIVLGWALGLALFALWLWVVTKWAGGERAVFDIRVPAAGASATVGGAILGAARKKLGELAPRLLGWFLPILPPVALLLLLIGLGALGWSAARILSSGEVVALFSTRIRIDPIWSWIFAGFALLYLFYANLNLSGLHRFYRDRLMETFMPDLDDVHADRPSSMTKANTAELAGMFDPGCAGPYHLVNANVVLLDSAHARYRSRKSDSFVLAPLYSGSEATGWARTDRWLAERGTGLIRQSGPMTLATAMAISGAAVNPNTGADGRGITKTAALSAVLTILNIRLGYWASSPRQHERARRLLFHPPNFIFPGLIQGIFGTRRTERSNWLELTDGGHFDNIGLYELVRRRVRTIYLIDGTEDQKTTFSSFANAAEKIYIDFNVQLKFADESGFIKLMRGADPDANPLNKAYQLAERGFAVGSIEYPAVRGAQGEVVDPAMTGIIYYIKATLTKGLPDALYSYRADNEAFPSQSTADQFFDEQQFEGYRALGFALAAQLTTHLARERAAAAERPTGRET